MKKSVLFISVLFIITACEKVLIEKDTAISPAENFESLWKTADEKYSFFEYKHIDWTEIYNIYSQQITNDMTDEQLFYELGNMLNELHDGHVNLVSPFNISRYNFDYSNPENFNFRLLKENYIGWDYNITGPLINTFIERDGSLIGYIYYGSFSSMVSTWHIDYVISRFRNTKGLILDMRSNRGGAVTNIHTIGSRLADKKRLIYSSALKNGPGHNDFGKPVDVFMEPDPDSNIQYSNKVILLTNRGCFSATSFFSTAMKAFPNVIQIGDTTGGGMGAPTGFELPNGWSYRFSCSRTLSADGHNWENGVPPDIVVWMNPQNELLGIDDIMERAILEIVEDR